MDNKWTQLSQSPDDFFAGNSTITDIIRINDDEFAVLPFRTSGGVCWGILKYNAMNDKWIQWIEYPNDFYINPVKGVFNKHNQKLYICKQYWTEKWMVIDTKSKSMNYINTNTGFGTPNSWSGVMIDQKIHFFSGDKSIKHFSCDLSDNSDGFNHTNTCNLTNYNAKSMNIIRNQWIYMSTIYVPSKSILLLIGDKLDYIYVFSLLLKKWTKTNVVYKMECSNANTVLTADEKYVLIVNQNEIFILDITANHCDKFKLRKSDINCPQNKINCVGCIFNHERTKKDELLVIGFVKNMFALPQKTEVPFCIIKFISDYYSLEMLHWISTYNHEHYFIPMNHILEVTSDMFANKITKGGYARLKGLTEFIQFNGRIVQIEAYSQKDSKWKVKLYKTTKYLDVKEENLDSILGSI